MSQGDTIAVAGAGIAGLGASIAMTLAGLKCKTYEREDQIRPIGAGIQLGPTATRIMRRWGVTLPETVCAPDHIELRSAVRGKLLNTIPLGQQFEDRYGAPYLTLLRADLQASLLSRAMQVGCDLAFASPLKFIGRSDAGVQIEVAGATIETAALIGADGVQSATRAATSLIRAVPAAITIWRTLLPAAALPAPYRNQVTVWMGDGAHLVHYPVDGGDRINVVMATDGAFPNADSETAKHVRPPTRLTASWATVPKTALDSAMDWAIWPVLTVPRWKGGNRCVQAIGDAWHAMPPFLASGAVMAIEDAEALSASLSAAQGRVIAGLERFRDNRSARVWRVSAQSDRMGRIYHLGTPFSVARDLTLRSMSSQSLLRRNDWLYAANARSTTS